MQNWFNIKKNNFSVKIKPIIIIIFFITKNNLLNCIGLKNGKIIYSYRIKKLLQIFKY